MKRASNSFAYNLENAGTSAARLLRRRKMGEVSPSAMRGLGVARPAAVGVSRADPILYIPPTFVQRTNKMSTSVRILKPSRNDWQIFKFNQYDNQ